MEKESEKTLQYKPVYDKRIAANIRNEFSRLQGQCYLDHAGATLYSDLQIKSVSDDLCNSLYGNPHSIGIAGGITHDNIEQIRHRILSHFHTSSEEYSIIFTSGATQSLKVVAETFRFNNNKNNEVQSTGDFVYTQDNHTSVLGMREVISQKGIKVTCLSHKHAFQVLEQPVNSFNDNVASNNNSLFVYPAQCNFSGAKYPLKWIKNAQNNVLSSVTGQLNTKWYVLLDAAGFVPTNDLNLSVFKPDFVCISFYKMFGYPTGIGALLVKNSSAHVLEKIYYGGGTVEVTLSSELFHVKRLNLHQRFEDGTVPFLSIISLQYGLDILSKITMKQISSHVFALARYLHHTLLRLRHDNGAPVVKIYSDNNYEDPNLQGGIITFNILRSNGEYVGYMEVAHMAALFKIHLRTGCFCNPGACQRHLSLKNEDVLKNYDAGYVCGGTADLINGRPTGAVRISIGYMSMIEDIETLLQMITKCFVSKPERNICVPEVRKSHHTEAENKKYVINDKDNTKEFESKAWYSSFLYGAKYFQNTNNSKSNIIIKKLFIYPIKSCSAFEITTSWTLNEKGLEYDREWMIMTSNGVCLTQKQQTNLCLIKPFICKETEVMKLTYPGMPSIEVPLEYSDNYINGAICQSRVCGQKVKGIDCGGDVSEWLSLVIGRPNLKLVKQADHETKDKPKQELNNPKLSFTSQAQYLLLNEESILWLCSKITDTQDFNKNTVVHRFRGNIILSGCKAFEELQWKVIQIGKIKFQVNGPCNRCQMICIDQTTGAKTVEPLRTLAEEFHGKLRFGIYLTRPSIKEGILNIGDVVYFE
ncbi:PREDICTED: molybdenum cofactor sulfurase 1 isoform X1 [Polistes canadensis]|uniref:molybdenum cofactor sulfurase 1 isoform X1 n=2 Tax=Polistes canadensis TaxID=91411 RepID=UPI000718AD49|nr:PREDICTED: molybdenum cofactor sulfurase 1 isoform X1 [Polistes canadensis]XP_014598700.1 PREDICTED: molybdenum cofactor sulfurase 1 isoform X1 [Polistes canadensis]XP_014598701.1 PREDICTED: molybdenum cofactor sulfurase 1 isoform X1 [Polistes canadensis]XP_014598702.1 PREDICTED: molybdenum cofactor sulfurase 1 isoform X1 [Polistes canadensis]